MAVHQRLGTGSIKGAFALDAAGSQAIHSRLDAVGFQPTHPRRGRRAAGLPARELQGREVAYGAMRAMVDHLWRVPLLIATMSSRYRFYLRAHAEDCWDVPVTQCQSSACSRPLYLHHHPAGDRIESQG